MCRNFFTAQDSFGRKSHDLNKTGGLHRPPAELQLRSTARLRLRSRSASGCLWLRCCRDSQVICTWSCVRGSGDRSGRRRSVASAASHYATDRDCERQCKKDHRHHFATGLRTSGTSIRPNRPNIANRNCPVCAADAVTVVGAGVTVTAKAGVPLVTAQVVRAGAPEQLRVTAPENAELAVSVNG
jgi:hypothetical protein